MHEVPPSISSTAFGGFILGASTLSIDYSKCGILAQVDLEDVAQDVFCFSSGKAANGASRAAKAGAGGEADRTATGLGAGFIDGCSDFPILQKCPDTFVFSRGTAASKTEAHGALRQFENLLDLPLARLDGGVGPKGKFPPGGIDFGFGGQEREAGGFHKVGGV
jgi:hypothetical protein